MERSAIRECLIQLRDLVPDFAALHPGYRIRYATAPDARSFWMVASS